MLGRLTSAFPCTCLLLLGAEHQSTCRRIKLLRSHLSRKQQQTTQAVRQPWIQRSVTFCHSWCQVHTMLFLSCQAHKLQEPLGAEHQTPCRRLSQMTVTLLRSRLSRKQQQTMQAVMQPWRRSVTCLSPLQLVSSAYPCSFCHVKLRFCNNSLPSAHCPARSRPGSLARQPVYGIEAT